MRSSIDELAQLSGNWNTYGASPPNAAARRAAKEVLAVLEQLEFVPDRVAASAESGVDIIFSRHRRFADIECFNDGDIVALISSGNGSPVAWEITGGTDGVVAAVRRIRDFVQKGQDPEADATGE